MINIFIGYDPSESLAYHVLCHSIMRRTSEPVAITPIRRDTLRQIHDRPDDPNASTEFSFTRFLTPYLQRYSGWCIFMDCDMLCRADVAELWAMQSDRYAVMCVQHDYSPAGKIKMLGARQTKYEKKNWSSLMLMNADKCRALTPHYVNKASGLDLHQFKWLEHDDLIGELPREWNWLVGEYWETRKKDPKLLHYTLGGPWWAKYRDIDHSEIWRDELESMMAEGSNAAARLV